MKPDLSRKEKLTKIVGGRAFCHSILEDQARIRDKSLEKMRFDHDLNQSIESVNEVVKTEHETPAPEEKKLSVNQSSKYLKKRPIQLLVRSSDRKPIISKRQSQLILTEYKSRDEFMKMRKESVEQTEDSCSTQNQKPYKPSENTMPVYQEARFKEPKSFNRIPLKMRSPKKQANVVPYNYS